VTCSSNRADSKPLRVLPPRPRRQLAKRVVNTIPLSDSIDAGAPWRATAVWKVATTASPVTRGNAPQASSSREWSSRKVRISTSRPVAAL
jgi:hypothetical protein